MMRLAIVLVLLAAPLPAAPAFAKRADRPSKHTSQPEAAADKSASPSAAEGKAPAPGATASNLAALFPTVAGWKLQDKPSTYSPETLFEYIDGGADTFLLFDFEELAAASYRNEAKAEVTVDIYRHRTPVRAFGMYTQERPPGTTPIPVGTDCYAGADHLEMVVGPYYVKMTLARSDDTAILRSFADRVAALLPGTREAPTPLAWFPPRGKLPRAERLTARDFLGYSFLHDAYAAPYEIDGTRFRLFIIEAKDEAEARDMVRRYMVAAKAGDTTVKPEGSTTLNDAMNGPVLLSWRGRWLWGAVDASSAEPKPLLQELARRIPAR